MKFLFTLSPLESHLQPMLPTIRAAVGLGHDVVVATGPELIRDLRRAGLRTWTVGPAARQAWVDLQAAHPANRRARLTDPASALYAQPAVARVLDLLPQIERWRPDIVVHDALELAGAEVAARTGAVQLVHGLGPHTDRRFPILPAVSAEIARTLGRPDRFLATAAAPYLDPTPPALGEPNRTFDDVRRVRPEADLAGRGQRLPLRVQRMPHQQTVLLALGPTIDRPGPVLAALEGLRHVPVNVIIETGPQLEVGALGPLPDRIAAGRSLPLDAVLPLVDAVISDGSTMIDLAAFRHGRPQVILPLTEPDRELAVRVARSGSAVVLNPDRVSPGAIRRGLADVLHLPGYAAAARQLREQFLALPTVHHVLDRLTAVPVAA